MDAVRSSTSIRNGRHCHIQRISSNSTKDFSWWTNQYSQSLTNADFFAAISEYIHLSSQQNKSQAGPRHFWANEEMHFMLCRSTYYQFAAYQLVWPEAWEVIWMSKGPILASRKEDIWSSIVEELHSRRVNRLIPIPCLHTGTGTVVPVDVPVEP